MRLAAIKFSGIAKFSNPNFHLIKSLKTKAGGFKLNRVNIRLKPSVLVVLYFNLGCFLCAALGYSLLPC